MHQKIIRLFFACACTITLSAGVINLRAMKPGCITAPLKSSDEPSAADKVEESVVEESVKAVSYYLQTYSDEVKNHVWQQKSILVCGFRDFLHRANLDAHKRLHDQYQNFHPYKLPQHIRELLEIAIKQSWGKYFGSLPMPSIGQEDPSDNKELSLEEMGQWQENFVAYCTEAQATLALVAQSICPEGKYS